MEREGLKVEEKQEKPNDRMEWNMRKFKNQAQGIAYWLNDFIYFDVFCWLVKKYHESEG